MDLQPLATWYASRQGMCPRTITWKNHEIQSQKCDTMNHRARWNVDCPVRCPCFARTPGIPRWCCWTIWSQRAWHDMTLIVMTCFIASCWITCCTFGSFGAVRFPSWFQDESSFVKLSQGSFTPYPLRDINLHLCVCIALFSSRATSAFCELPKPSWGLRQLTEALSPHEGLGNSQRHSEIHDPPCQARPGTGGALLGNTGMRRLDNSFCTVPLTLHCVHVETLRTLWWSPFFLPKSVLSASALHRLWQRFQLCPCPSSYEKSTLAVQHFYEQLPLYWRSNVSTICIPSIRLATSQRLGWHRECQNVSSLPALGSRHHSGTEVPRATCSNQGVPSWVVLPGPWTDTWLTWQNIAFKHDCVLTKIIGGLFLGINGFRVFWDQPR